MMAPVTLAIFPAGEEKKKEMLYMCAKVCTPLG